MQLQNESRQILVVDDDPSNNRLMQKTLEISGYHVESASDGRGALKLMGEKVFDAVLLDLRMPERDGFELCRLIRVNPQFNHVAIITMSGLGDLPTIQRALSCGANDFVTKPWSPEELILRLSTAIRWMGVEKRLSETRSELQRIESELTKKLASFSTTTQRRLEAVESELPQPTEEEWATSRRRTGLVSTNTLR